MTTKKNNNSTGDIWTKVNYNINKNNIVFPATSPTKELVLTFDFNTNTSTKSMSDVTVTHDINASHVELAIAKLGGDALTMEGADRNDTTKNEQVTKNDDRKEINLFPEDSKNLQVSSSRQESNSGPSRFLTSRVFTSNDSDSKNKLKQKKRKLNLNKRKKIAI